MRIERVGKTSPGMKIDTINVNQCSLGKGKQMVFWVSKMGMDFDSEAASRVGYVDHGQGFFVHAAWLSQWLFNL